MGLLGSIAKTAVVAGTAQATRNAVNRRGAEKNVRAYSEAAAEVQGEEVAYTSPQSAPTDSQEDVISQLERLGALRDQGVLTEEEFAAQKAKLLGS
jgi:predicted Zn-dependent peptidase